MILALAMIQGCRSQCPWSRDSGFRALQPSCLCQLSKEQTLSIQCQKVEFPILSRALQSYGQGIIIEVLMVNNSSVVALHDFVFKNLKIINLQISNAGLTGIASNAFRGLENTLQNLDLSKNRLRTVPVDALRQLRLVSTLDLSANRINFVPGNAFVTLRLKTLKMAENNVTLAENSLRGLETSLKNLNLKTCHLKEVPLAVQNLNGLAFLDLAQNHIRTIKPGTFRKMNSLTALNLERNIVQILQPNVFQGVHDTLSSLSLLNNLITDYPLEAINSLKDLRVSDCVASSA